MKRTNLVLDEHLLDEALRVSGERTYSRTVERALRDLVRRAHAGRILELAGSGLWEGDLALMRDDQPVAKSSAEKPASRRRLAASPGKRGRSGSAARRGSARNLPSDHGTSERAR